MVLPDYWGSMRGKLIYPCMKGRVAAARQNSDNVKPPSEHELYENSDAKVVRSAMQRIRKAIANELLVG
jgi:hypothetical protein